MKYIRYHIGYVSSRNGHPHIRWHLLLNQILCLEYGAYAFLPMFYLKTFCEKDYIRCPLHMHNEHSLWLILKAFQPGDQSISYPHGSLNPASCLICARTSTLSPNSFTSRRPSINAPAKVYQQPDNPNRIVHSGLHRLLLQVMSDTSCPPHIPLAEIMTFGFSSKLICLDSSLVIASLNPEKARRIDAISDQLHRFFIKAAVYILLENSRCFHPKGLIHIYFKFRNSGTRLSALIFLRKYSISCVLPYW